MDLYSKNFALTKRQLRKFNNLKVIFMDGTQGKILYPYVSIRRRQGYEHLNLENDRVFQEVKRIENGRVLVAERRTPKAPLLTTGRGIKNFRGK